MRRDPCGAKARIAARIILRHEAGRRLTARDFRLAQRFAEDKGVEGRLIEQAVANIGVQQRRRSRPSHVIV
jgi:hypothetical protein